MLANKEVIKSIKNIPEHFTIDDAIDRLIVLNKIEKHERKSLKGKD